MDIQEKLDPFGEEEGLGQCLTCNTTQGLAEFAVSMGKPWEQVRCSCGRVYEVIGAKEK